MAQQLWVNVEHGMGESNGGLNRDDDAQYFADGPLGVLLIRDVVESVEHVLCLRTTVGEIHKVGWIQMTKRSHLASFS